MVFEITSDSPPPVPDPSDFQHDYVISFSCGRIEHSTTLSETLRLIRLTAPDACIQKHLHPSVLHAWGRAENEFPVWVNADAQRSFKETQESKGADQADDSLDLYRGRIAAWVRRETTAFDAAWEEWLIQFANWQIFACSATRHEPHPVPPMKPAEKRLRTGATTMTRQV